MMVHACNPSTWKAEARELLEPGRWRLQGAQMAPLHSSLDNKSVSPSQTNKITQNSAWGNRKKRERTNKKTWSIDSGGLNTPNQSYKRRK